jgi:hypothetical protein
MLETIRGLISPSEKVLYKSRDVKVIEENNRYVFVPNGRDVRSGIIVGTNRYELDEDNVDFSKELVNENNAAVYRNSTEFVLGDSVSDVTVDVFLNEVQINLLNSVSFNRGDNVLSTKTDIEYEVYNLDGWWCISMTGLMENIPYDMRLSFGGGLPDVKYEDISGSTGLSIDISDMEERYIGCTMTGSMEGDYLINKSSRSSEMLQDGTIPLTDVSVSTLYLSSDDNVSEEIREWNDTEVKVVARPDNYTNVARLKQLTERVTMFNFDFSAFDKLATIELEYPEYIDASPWISLGDTEYEDDVIPDYVKDYEYENGVCKFNQSVYPSEEITIFHGDALWFEDNTTRTSVESGETKSFNPELTQKKVEFNITNDYDESVVLNINGEARHISPKNSCSVEVSLEDENQFSVETVSGDTIISCNNASREQLLKNNDTGVIELSLQF